jgi:hypothetical protein
VAATPAKERKYMKGYLVTEVKNNGVGISKKEVKSLIGSERRR